MDDKTKLLEKERLFHEIIDAIHDLLDNHLKAPNSDLIVKKYAIDIIVALIERLDISYEDIVHKLSYNYVKHNWDGSRNDT